MHSLSRLPLLSRYVIVKPLPLAWVAVDGRVVLLREGIQLQVMPQILLRHCLAVGEEHGGLDAVAVIQGPLQTVQYAPAAPVYFWFFFRLQRSCMLHGGYMSRAGLQGSMACFGARRLYEIR